MRRNRERKNRRDINWAFWFGWNPETAGDRARQGFRFEEYVDEFSSEPRWRYIPLEGYAVDSDGYAYRLP